MQIKRVKCSHCGVVLEVKNSKNETLKQITCPQCMSSLQVKFDPTQEPLDAETVYAPKKASIDAATQLASKSSMMDEKHAALEFHGQIYPLSEGLNVIGRFGNTSKATVQIKADDLYMSRQHVTIEISTLSDGTIKAILSNFKNKNQTTVDGQTIEADDKIRLSDGNSITMGNTTVTFKIT